MKIEQGLAALVTGGGSGIGRALALALSRKGVTVTVVDYAEERGLETASLVEVEHSKLSIELKCPAALFIRCDVANSREIANAFGRHMELYGRLDICINNAGIAEEIPFPSKKETIGNQSWRRVVDVNLSAVIDCTHLAIQAMTQTGHHGTIINIGSAAGLYPAKFGPVYSASKGGVVMFTRSLKSLSYQGIRVNVLCPEFVETDLALKLSPEVIKSVGGYISIERIIEGTFQLIEDETKAGSCLWITNRRGLEYWPTVEEEKKYKALSGKARLDKEQRDKPPGIILPKQFKKIIVHTLSNNFRHATKIISVPFAPQIKAGHVLIKYLFAGVNASDINYSSGNYFKSKEEALEHLPFDAGFETVGIVAGLGSGSESFGLSLGSPVATISYGGFAEYGEVLAKYAFPVPAPTPEVVALLVSGLTASIALEEAGKIRSNETVLVTAAAGGTGQFAVQLAVLAGNKVIATCGGEGKASLLSSLGVHRVINYKVEDVKMVLKREYPMGVDLIYESVGGVMFDTCLNALAVCGRLLIIGMVSQYQGKEGWQPRNYPGMCEKLLAKSQSLVGFFLMDYSKLWRRHIEKLYNLYTSSKLKVAIDPMPFIGLNSVADAVEYLNSGQSIGKVVVQISKDVSMVQSSRL